MKRIAPSELQIHSSPPVVSPGNTTQCFLVHYDGGMASVAALNSALDLMDLNTEVIAVTPLLILPTQRLDAPNLDLEIHARAALAGATTKAALRGVEIVTKIVECSDPGRAMVEEARAQNAALVFWGVERAEVESGLNPSVQYVLKHAPSKVVLVGS